MLRLVHAFRNSLNALKFGLTREAALREEMCLILLSLPVALWLTQEPWKLIAMWGSLLMLLSIELLNTGLEKLADRVTTDNDRLVKVAKDCGSAAVLMVIVTALAVWGLVAYERFLSGV